MIGLGIQARARIANPPIGSDTSGAHQGFARTSINRNLTPVMVYKTYFSRIFVNQS